MVRTARTWLAVASLILTAATVGAADRGPRVPPERVEPGRLETLLSPPAGASTDTFLVLGDPDGLAGKFETAGGLPDPQGWTGVDLSEEPASHWSVSTFMAANLAPDQPGNHAWWCGDLFEPCYPEDPPEGVGHDWYEQLRWTGTVPDPDLGVTVRVQAVMNHDIEPGEDYLHLQHATSSGYTDFAQWSGQGLGVPVDASVTLTPADYLGDQGNEVHLRWLLTTDGAWSDEDCLWPTAGGAQIDSIQVTFDQGSGAQVVGWVETCEDGAPLQWTPHITRGVGDYAQVWPALDDLDPADGNATPQVAFIDDGEVEPDSDGTPCITWCYGPGGFIVPTDQGLAELTVGIANEFRSPPLALPTAGLDGAVLAFDLYLHSGEYPAAPYMFPTWRLRSTADLETWSAWTETPFVLWGGPEYLRVEQNLSDAMVPGATHVQVGLGVFNYVGAGGHDGTPGPYFDNVRLAVFQRQGGAVFPVQADGQGPYATIQDAILAAASGDTVELADGVYSSQGNREIDFMGKGLVIRSASGDPATCVVDCEATLDQHYRAFDLDGTAPGAGLAGLTIRNGIRTRDGGAVRIADGSATIEHCVFEANRTTIYGGGAVFVSGGSAAIHDCSFIGNQASSGAAVMVSWSHDVSVSECLFVDNQADQRGAGVLVSGPEAMATVVNCTFAENDEFGDGSVIVAALTGHVVVDRCIVAHTRSGSALGCESNGTVAVSCTDLFANEGGDWVGCVADQEGVDGNLALDPLFCGPALPDDPWAIDASSPCAPEAGPCGLVGARPVGCDTGTAAPAAAARVELSAARPNPANPATTVSFTLPSDGPVWLGVYDLRGRLIRRLVEGSRPAGRHAVTWRGRDDSGRSVASGVYLMRLAAAGTARTVRVMIVR